VLVLVIVVAVVGQFLAAPPGPNPSTTVSTTSEPSAATPSPGPSALTPPSGAVWTGSAATGGGYTVMSYNLTDASRSPAYAGMTAHAADFAWSRRGPVIASWIAWAHPDLLGLQEANPVRGGGEQIDLLRAALPDYTWVYPQRTTALAFRRSAFTLLDSGVIRVSRKRQDGSHYNRYAPWAKLRTTSGKTLIFVNLHAEFGQTKAKAQARSAGWDRLTAGLAKINPDGKLPLILTGDFNASTTETRAVYRDHLVKLKAAGLVSAQEAASVRQVRVAGASSYNGFGAVIGGVWRYRAIRRDADGESFDYVWVDRKVKAVAWQLYLGPRINWQLTDGRLVPYAEAIPSDHWPVLARVRLA
jgi:endonuclease/exonuclease/phosphatase family metal-dependent hydrolase